MPREREGPLSGDIARYVGKLDFPATKHQVVHAVRQAGAPDTVVTQLEAIPVTEFHSLDQLRQAYQGG
jgi:hypothetical protein